MDHISYLIKQIEELKAENAALKKRMEELDLEVIRGWDEQEALKDEHSEENATLKKRVAELKAEIEILEKPFEETPIDYKKAAETYRRLKAERANDKN